MNVVLVLRLLFATVLFSFVGLLVKIISLPSASIAFSRALSGAVALVTFFIVLKRPLFVLRRKADLLPLFLLGIFMSGNWFFFFAAIKVSTIAIGVISLFTYPFITALIEPLVFRKRHNPVDLIGAIFVVIGVVLVVPRFAPGDSTFIGVFFGVISAVSLTFGNILNKRMLRNYDVLDMMLYQFTIATVLFLPAARPFIGASGLEIAYCVLLGAVLTTVGVYIFIDSFRYISASTAGILSSLQPFVTVLLAVVFLGEMPSRRTIAGGLLICGTVTAVSLCHAFRQRKASD